MKKLKAGIDYVWLVYGPNVWGKGRTLKEAMANASKNCGPNAARDLKKNHAVYLAPPSVYVDDLGGICWKTEEGKPDNCIMVSVTRGGLVISPGDWV